jgi:hypothetical protein
MPWYVKAFKYAKAIGAALVPVYLVIEAATTDGTITGDEWHKIIAAVVGAVIVYFVPNKGYVNTSNPARGGTIPPRTSTGLPTYNDPPSRGSSGPLE